jgi:hypothetical protein
MLMLQSYPLAPRDAPKDAPASIEMHGVISRKALLSLLDRRSAFLASQTVGACCLLGRGCACNFGGLLQDATAAAGDLLGGQWLVPNSQVELRSMMHSWSALV